MDMAEIPTEVIEAGEYAALARKRHSQNMRGEARSWLTGDEMEQARAAVRAAAPHLIAEGRRRAAAELALPDPGTVPAEAYTAAADVILEHSGQFTDTELAIMSGRVGQRNERLRQMVDKVWHMAVAAGRHQYFAELATRALGDYEPVEDETPALMGRFEREVRAKVAAEIRAMCAEDTAGPGLLVPGLTVAASIAEGNQP